MLPAALYLINQFSGWPLERIIGTVPFAAVVAGGVAALIALIARLWAPRASVETSTFVVYIAMLASWSIAVALTTVGSPFTALWAVALSGAIAFGGRGLIVALVALVGVLGWKLYSGQSLEYVLPSFVLLGIAPLVTGVVLWSKHASSGEATSEDRSYHELATQLSQVAGKSEVVINAITDGVLALNSKGTIELISPSAQRIIGWGKQDALALDYRSVLKLVDANGQELVAATDPVQQVLNTNQPVNTDKLSLLTSSGKSLLVSLVVSPIGQAGSGVIIVFRDITREKAEERQQAEFISTASHEMRTPVASIEGYLGLALNPATATIDAKARDFIEKAHASAEHLGRLFQDLLDVSKAEDGRLANNPKVVDVVPFVHDIALGLKPKADEKNLRFMYKPLPDDDTDDRDKLTARQINPVYFANVDNDHLREVVANLIENAIKYTLKGDVVIDVGGDDEHVVVSITDSGIGIPKEDQSHLFQKFYRVDNSDTREIGGTGLGLYLCRRLAEAMGGRIWLESEYKQGSTFYLEIPRISHEKATQLIEQAGLEQPVPTETVVSSVDSVPLTVPTPPPEPPVAPIVVPPAPPAPTPSVVPATPAPNPPVTTVPDTSMRPNTPLSSIEANPNQYTRSREGNVSIPPRS